MKIKGMIPVTKGTMQMTAMQIAMPMTNPTGEPKEKGKTPMTTKRKRSLGA
jgi:hypothetical protein